MPVIADHLGGIVGLSKLSTESDGRLLAQSGLDSLISLAKRSQVIVKISGLYRMSTDTGSVYYDLKPIIQKFAQEIPGRLIWASDWPHTGEAKERKGKSLDDKESFRKVDNREILRHLNEWMGQKAWERMMVDNPHQFFR